VLILLGSSTLLSACASDSPRRQPPPSTTAIELAPSQITAETVPAPELPPPCEIADLVLWTAQVIVAAGSADAVIRVRNDGDVWCEVNVSQSPNIDPLMEPDVWLDSGGLADLVVGQSGDECLSRAPVTLVELDINGVKVVVPTAMVATCGWQLIALYPNEISSGPCDPDELEAVGTHFGFLVVRNRSANSCTLGELIGASLLGTELLPFNLADNPASPATVDLAIVDLAVGDAVAFRMQSNPRADCDISIQAHQLSFSIAGTVTARLPTCTLYEPGPGRPFYGDPGGPLWNLPPGPFDVRSALAELDPFAQAIN
jgi:hypothetical protein